MNGRGSFAVKARACASSGRRCRPQAAFTLIELLVVVSIIALLLALLAPLLARANQIARRVQCETNMKVTGSAVQIFAGSHYGRAPAHAARSDESYVGFWGELALDQTISNTLTKNVYAKGSLDCPEVARDPSYLYWFQTFQINQDVTDGRGPHPHPHTMNGQPYVLNGVGQAGTDGMYMPGPPPGYIFYAVGRAIQDFPRAGMKFMVWECSNSGGDETYGPGWDSRNTSPIPLAPAGSMYSPWYEYHGTGGGGYCFRHMIPTDLSMIVANCVQNFLFIDGHVETLGIRDHINYDDRFGFDY